MSDYDLFVGNLTLRAPIRDWSAILSEIRAQTKGFAKVWGQFSTSLQVEKYLINAAGADLKFHLLVLKL